MTKRGTSKPNENSSKKQESIVANDLALLSADIFHILLEETEAPIMILQDGKILFINKNGMKKFGYPAENTVGEKVASLVRKRVEKSARDLALEAYNYYLLAGFPNPMPTIPIVAENGDCIPIRPKVALIEYNHRPALLLLLQDLREKEPPSSHNSSKEEQDAAKLRADIAHELRTPLQLIRNAEYYVQQELQTNRGYQPNYEKMLDMLKVVKEVIKKMDQIIKGLSEPPNGKSDQNREYSS
jgi:PAS domain S-box-containing protein